MSKQQKRHQPGRNRSPAAAKPANHYNELVPFLSTIADIIARHSSINLLNQDRRQRALGSYIFGILLAYGRREDLPPPIVMGAMNMLLITKFGYTMQTADQLTRELINATEPGHDPVQHSLIYRGIASLTDWAAVEPHAAANDFLACLASTEASSTSSTTLEQALGLAPKPEGSTR